MRLFLLTLLFFLIPSHSAFSDSDLETVYKEKAKKCADLACVRRNIDGINDGILHLLVERTAYVQRAGDFKLHTKIATDQKRVDDQLQVIRQKSEALGLPKEISLETFKAIIKQSIEFEQKYLDQGGPAP